jgi:hypothetical protein
MMTNPITFSAGEAEVITGVSTTLQRDWRRHGYLPESGGRRARFTVRDLAHLLIIKCVADVGDGPGRGARLAKKAAAIVETIALQKAGLPAFGKTADWAIILSNGEFTFADDLVGAFKNVPMAQRPSMLCVDLDLLGSILAKGSKAIGKPFVTREANTNEIGRAARPDPASGAKPASRRPQK